MADDRDEEQREDVVAEGTSRGRKRTSGRGQREAAREDGSEEVGEDEETWTNKPAPSTDVAGDGHEDDLEDEEEPPPVTRKVIQNGRDVLCEELPSRAQRAKTRLKPHLTCTLGLELSSSGERFIFDWKGEEPTVVPTTKSVSLTDESSRSTVVDSIISLTEQNLMAIRSGDLNPQVAMLAEKIKVKGKIGPAVYLFNLIAPRAQQ